jgi:MORN repeat variant
MASHRHRPRSSRLALAALGAVTLAAAPPLPLDCPPGTRLVGGAPPEEFEAYCEGHPDAYGHPRRHGPARTYYDDGAPWVSETWLEGKRDGPFEERHRNGRSARAGNYLADRKDGTWSAWSESGQLLERSEWVRGLENGRFESWYPSGARRVAGRFCFGVQCGTWITWSEDGQELGRMELGELRDRP